jgi:hypothetical protein
MAWMTVEAVAITSGILTSLDRADRVRCGDTYNRHQRTWTLLYSGGHLECSVPGRGRCWTIWLSFASKRSRPSWCGPGLTTMLTAAAPSLLAAEQLGAYVVEIYVPDTN